MKKGYKQNNPLNQSSKLKAMNSAQQTYLDAIDNNTIIFSEGVAGSGKSYLAAYKAVEYLNNGWIDKIYLIRPNIEAKGLSVGYLPGELNDKIGPYLEPIISALEEMLGKEKVKMLMTKEVISIKAAGFLRGHTFKNSMVLIDEAQNLTYETMKMILTRIGENCKMILTGDINQSDLHSRETSGIVSAFRILKDVPKIAMCRFNKEDVVRSEMCKLIEDAYDRHEETNPRKSLRS